MKIALKIQVVTLFPQMFSALSDNGVTGRAVQKGLVQLGTINPRDYTHDRHNTVDDRPYGGGPGMVMMVEAAMTTCGRGLGSLKIVLIFMGMVNMSGLFRNIRA